MAADCSARRCVVVVGVDGGPASLLALRRALDEARATNGLVEMVTAWTAHDVTDVPSAWAAAREARRRAVAHQRAALAACADALDVPLTGVVVEGPAREMLALAGRGAACVVLGRALPGRSATARSCAAEVDCRVLEVRPPAADVPLQRPPDRPTMRRPIPRLTS